MDCNKVLFSGHAVKRMFEKPLGDQKENPRGCLVCRQGESGPGKVTVTLQRGETTIIIKGVTAEICENCGEYYLEEQITDQVLAMAEEAVGKNVEVEILRFAA